MSNIFISYSSLDKSFARKLSKSIIKHGYHVWLDEWVIFVGDSIVQKIQKGLDECDFLVLVLSKNATASSWVEAEWQAKYWQEIMTFPPKTVPVESGVQRC